MTLKEEIRDGLARLKPRRLESGYARKAAVLMPVCHKDGAPHFLLTRRTEGVSTHKGQISFPGGMCLEEESLQDAALRETFEEVGIDRNRIDVLGRFHDYIAITNYLVAPFAGYIEGEFTTTPQKDEVAEVLLVPFSVFADPDRLRSEPMMRSGKMQTVYFYRYEPYEIWGLTARIIKEFLDLLWKHC